MEREWQGVRDADRLILNEGGLDIKQAIGGRSVDYLSITFSWESLSVLEQIKDLDIKCLTIRHDGYEDEGVLMNKQRKALCDSFELEMAGNTNGDGHNDFWVK